MNSKNTVSDEQFEKICQDVLKRGPGHVTVVTAIPGSGKSRAAQEAISSLRAGGLERVLWMTHSTRSDKGRVSLAEEARQRFADLLTPAQIMYGRSFFEVENPVATQTRDLTGINFKQQYLAQFAWPTGSQVKLLSHAHLTPLYGPQQRSHALISPAQLLVIDEDPCGSLICSSSPDRKKLKLSHLNTANTLTPLAQAIRDVMRAVVAQAYPTDDFLNIARPDQVLWSFTGAGFLSALSHALKGQVFDHNALRQVVPWTDRWIAGQLAHDLGISGGTHRFGVQWISRTLQASAKEIADTVQFRYDVLTPLDLLPPTLILDAYAEEQYYQAMFPGRKIFLVSLDGQVSPRLPVRVTHAPHLGLKRQTVTRDRNLHRMQYVMNEIVEFTVKQHCASTVILCSKDTVKPLQAVLDALLKEKKVKANIRFQHWFSGRGSNLYRNNHIVALMQPFRPMVFWQHTLAALHPSDAGSRKKLGQRLDEVELLQMLHRNRQVQSSPDAADYPRVLLGFEHSQMPFDVTDADEEWPPTVVYRQHRANEQWPDTLRLIAPEIIGLLGALPSLALMAVGLLQTPKNYYVQVEHAARRLRGCIRSDRHKHLAAWKADPEHVRQLLGEASPRRADHSAAISAVLEAVLRDQNFTKMHASPEFGDRALGVYVAKPKSLVVWAADQTKGDTALFKLLK